MSALRNARAASRTFSESAGPACGARRGRTAGRGRAQRRAARAGARRSAPRREGSEKRGKRGRRRGPESNWGHHDFQRESWCDCRARPEATGEDLPADRLHRIYRDLRSVSRDTALVRARGRQVDVRRARSARVSADAHEAGGECPHHGNQHSAQRDLDLCKQAEAAVRQRLWPSALATRECGSAQPLDLHDEELPPPDPPRATSSSHARTPHSPQLRTVDQGEVALVANHLILPTSASTPRRAACLLTDAHEPRRPCHLDPREAGRRLAANRTARRGRRACPMAPTPHAVRERVARWGTTGRPPAGMIDAMTKHLIRRLRANRGQEDGDRRTPLRLLLGSYASRARRIERQSAEDRKWAFVSERTDFQEVAG